MTSSKVLLALPFIALLSGCDETKTQPTTVTRERSQAVLGASVVANPTPEVVPQKAEPAKPKTPRKLCGGSLSSKGSELSTDTVARKQATAERPLPERIDVSQGTTWINFWAAWCVPCKEEIPILLGWEKKLRADGLDFKVVFVSLDDDERQLSSFLEQQPAQGLRRSYWLTEGSKRTEWLGKVGMKADMELPAHLIVDGSGTVRCKLQGAIEESDFSQLSEMLHAKR